MKRVFAIAGLNLTQLFRDRSELMGVIALPLLLTWVFGSAFGSGSAQRLVVPVADSDRSVILDPFDPKVIEAARASGIEDSWISAAQNSPAYKFVKVWGLALPLHPEYRTMAMMYYIPPLSPVVSVIEEGLFRLDVSPDAHDFEMFEHLEDARLPVKYLANLFSAGNEGIIQEILRKLMAVRTYMRRKTVDGTLDEKTLALLGEAGTNPQEVEAIYRLTTLPTMDERFVIPQYHRETAIEAWTDPLARKGEAGFGPIQPPLRGV